MAASGNRRYRQPMRPPRWPLTEAIRRLSRTYGKPAPLVATDPFEMVVWESCAYLVDDERRRRVYDRLVARTGADPARLAGMPASALAALIEADGGMRPMMRAENLQRAANLVLDIGQAELRRLCRTEPDKARPLLKKFRGIADPGADKILMVSGSGETLGLESNGLRVLGRLGFGQVSADYTRTYRSVSLDVGKELPKSAAARIEAHRLLRLHGKTLCKTGMPLCAECPLAARCPSAM